MNRGIYVEILINGLMETIWEKTQSPGEHVQWDLRFTGIQYLPRPDESQPQRFLYQTRIGLGLAIRGEGETAGQRDSDAGRSSALSFWSNDSKSLIRKGAGYWKYVPVQDGITFLTWYDYETRFGIFGRLFDTAFFRPLMGWATAWSFDRLRLWIEKGVTPAASLQKSVIHGIARVALAAIWIYQGLIPKLMFQSADELRMLMDAGSSLSSANALLPVIGLLELLFGLALFACWRVRWLFQISILLMVAATVTVSWASPRYLVGAFNPISLNLAVAALSLIGYIAGAEIPSARRCRRRPQP